AVVVLNTNDPRTPAGTAGGVPSGAVAVLPSTLEALGFRALHLGRHAPPLVLARLHLTLFTKVVAAGDIPAISISCPGHVSDPRGGRGCPDHYSYSS
ncbi:MAG: hypothetical protein ACRDS9_25300, partial [Pseudonocardiaceae bacterium]